MGRGSSRLWRWRIVCHRNLIRVQRSRCSYASNVTNPGEVAVLPWFPVNTHFWPYDVIKRRPYRTITGCFEGACRIAQDGRYAVRSRRLRRTQQPNASPRRECAEIRIRLHKDKESASHECIDKRSSVAAERTIA